MRVRLPIGLLITCAVGLFLPSGGQAQLSPDVRFNVLNQREFNIPFSTDPKRPIKQLRLYAQHGGEWQYLTSAVPADKAFKFKCNEDGSYAITVQTEFLDGSTDRPTDQLTPQLRIVIDTVPPKIAVHAFSTGDSAGVEWDITDENLETNSIRLEYRWPGMVDWRPIDAGVQFRARDQRTWILKTDQRIEIRVKARDSAKNEGVSAAVWTSLGAGDQRKFATGSNTGGVGDPQRNDSPIRTANTSVQYVNEKDLKFDLNVTVGSSGLKRVRLWLAENHQDWNEKLPAWIPGPDHPAAKPEEKSRTERITINYTVEKEGEYGFILIPESKAGKAMPTPKPRDPAQIRVIVDLTPPKVVIKEAKVRKVGDDGVAVDVSWSAEDANMAPSPISIKYSTKRDGPWLPVTSNLDNTGRYTWNVSTTEQPHSFFLKLEAIDRAGNLGEDTSKEPVELDLVVPQVEIQGVTPGKSKNQDRLKDDLGGEGRPR